MGEGRTVLFLVSSGWQELTLVEVWITGTKLLSVRRTGDVFMPLDSTASEPASLLMTTGYLAHLE